MHTDGTQIKQGEKDYSLQSVTGQVVGAACRVHDILGFGFLEQVYQRAMQVEPQSRGLKVEFEPKPQVLFKGIIVGDYAAALLVENRAIIEFKTDTAYQTGHGAQLQNELRGTAICPGYLVNFGCDRLEYKRMVF